MVCWEKNKKKSEDENYVSSVDFCDTSNQMEVT